MILINMFTRNSKFLYSFTTNYVHTNTLSRDHKNFLENSLCSNFCDLSATIFENVGQFVGKF